MAVDHHFFLDLQDGAVFCNQDVFAMTVYRRPHLVLNLAFLRLHGGTLDGGALSFLPYGPLGRRGQRESLNLLLCRGGTAGLEEGLQLGIHRAD
jgi:hypothetical protein